jgi:hypothetical protein
LKCLFTLTIAWEIARSPKSKIFGSNLILDSYAAICCNKKPYKNSKLNSTSLAIPGIFGGSPLFQAGGCPDIAIGIGMGMSALRHCRRRKARTVFSDPQLTGLEKRFEAQR